MVGHLDGFTYFPLINNAPMNNNVPMLFALQKVCLQNNVQEKGLNQKVNAYIPLLENAKFS